VSALIRAARLAIASLPDTIFPLIPESALYMISA